LLSRTHRWNLFIVSLFAAASMWFYVDLILVGYQAADAVAHDRPRGNLSDLYPRWLGARELLLHQRNPYRQDITREIQRGYYGRELDASRPGDPRDQQGFAYPVYVVFLLAPLAGLSFHTVQIFFHWLLVGLTGASVYLWLRALRWRVPVLVVASCIALSLGSVPAVQGIKLQQLSLLVAALLAASAASVASGFLGLGGAILALATIKPQLAWPFVAWLLIWAASGWTVRRRLVFGFAATMLLLFVGSELILPTWWRDFLEAVRQYHQYTQNDSVLDQLVNWLTGRYGGTLLSGLAVVASAALLWRMRWAEADSEGFGQAVALVLSLTVLIVPMYAPYNQVLLLPAILLLIKTPRERMSSSGVMRMLYAGAGLALAWQWIASLGLTAAWFLSPAWALRGWKLPFYATFALPLLVFALLVLSVRHQQRALRVCKAAE
jgi:hypothetical protein